MVLVLLGAIFVLVVVVAVRQEVIRMASEAEFQAAFDRVNVATSAIAAILRDLRDKLKAGGLTAQQEDAELEKLGTVADALEAMAVEPANPVPIQPPA